MPGRAREFSLARKERKYFFFEKNKQKTFVLKE